MNFTVEAWSPDFGASYDGADEEPTAPTETGIETRDWEPIGPRVQPPSDVTFIDGVARVDAQVWIVDDDGPKPGLCASVAAGSIRCNARAVISGQRVVRSLVTGAVNAEPIETAHARYGVVRWAGDVDMLSQGVTERMRAVEAEVARTTADVPLMVLDGLLWGREDVPNAIGFIKSHRRRYLEDEHQAVVHVLPAGTRSPVFLVSTAIRSWYSWYLRLPGGSGHPMAGVVRCEASNQLDVPQVIALADIACAALPRFASEAHRDPRAPQNLYPIGGLEKDLRHRMGDSRLLERALRAAAHRRALNP